MRLWYGGKFQAANINEPDANEYRITKLMGESFKLHSQALAGYEDAVASGTVVTTPTMSSADVELGVEAAY